MFEQPQARAEVQAWLEERIVNPLAMEARFRGSQNWLSRPGLMRDIADFIPPLPALVHPMMRGVARVAALAAGRELDPVLAAACAAFGLVYVHPYLDGNGRLHR